MTEDVLSILAGFSRREMERLSSVIDPARMKNLRRIIRRADSKKGETAKRGTPGTTVVRRR